MEITTEQIGKLIESITTKIDAIEHDTETLEFDIEITKDISFFAQTFVNVSTEDDGDGWDMPLTSEITGVLIWIDDNEPFGAFDENMNECFFTPEQQTLIRKTIES